MTSSDELKRIIEESRFRLVVEKIKPSGDVVLYIVPKGKDVLDSLDLETQFRKDFDGVPEKDSIFTTRGKGITTMTCVEKGPSVRDPVIETVVEAYLNCDRAVSASR